MKKLNIFFWQFNLQCRKYNFFNTNSPKGCGNFGIGETDLELVFLACISIKHCNLIEILDVSHELKKM